MYNSKFLISLQFLDRFVFYSFISIIVLYLISPEDASREKAAYSYGVFLNLIYFLPLIFGFLSDLISRRFFMKIGFVLIGIGMCLFSSTSYSQEFTKPLLVIIAIGFACLRPNLIAYLFDSLLLKNSSQKIVYTLLYFGIVSVAAFFAPIYTNIAINYQNFNFALIVLGIANLLISGLILLRKTDSEIQEKINTIEFYPNFKIVLTLLFLSFFISLGYVFTNHNYNSEIGKQPYYSIIEFLIWIVLLVSINRLNIKDIDKYIKKLVLVFSILLAMKFIVFSLLGETINQISALEIIIEFIQILPKLMLVPLIYLSFYYVFSINYKISGIALLFVVSIIPYRIGYFFPILENSYNIYFGAICGIIIILLATIFKKSASLSIIKEST